MFLDDIRAYREQRLTAVGWTATFPLCRRDTGARAHELIDTGFEAALVCVDALPGTAQDVVVSGLTGRRIPSSNGTT